MDQLAWDDANGSSARAAIAVSTWSAPRLTDARCAPQGHIRAGGGWRPRPDPYQPKPAPTPTDFSSPLNAPPMVRVARSLIARW